MPVGNVFDGFVVVPDDIIFGKISGFPGYSIGGRHVEFGWIVYKVCNSVYKNIPSACTFMDKII